MYFSYHNRIKQRIANRELTGYVYSHHKFSEGVRPALILKFDKKPYTMPVREHRFKEYETLLTNTGG